MTRIESFVAAAVVVFVGLAVVVVAPPAPVPTATSYGIVEHQEDLDSFDIVWTTVRDRYWDPAMGGIDWDAVRDELRPRVEIASNRDEARAVTSAMLERLGLSHCQIIPAEVYGLLGGDAREGTRDGWTGITVVVVSGRALVRRIEPGSVAAGRGIGPGWEVVGIGDEEVPSLLAEVARDLEANRWRDAHLHAVVEARLEGLVGERVVVSLLDGRGRRKDVTLELAEKPGGKVQFGMLPATYVSTRTRELEGGVGYLMFTGFLDPLHLMPVIDSALESHLDAPGVVIDLRGNGGGLPGMALGIARWVVVKKGHSLGTVTTRGTTLRMVISPRPRTVAGRVAILVDCRSGSASEFLAGGLQDIGKARVFGSRSMGAVLPSIVEQLPNGDGFQYVFGNYVTASGNRLEGVGVAPDQEVVPTRSELIAGRDPVLERAVAWILDRSEPAYLTTSRSEGREM